MDKGTPPPPNSRNRAALFSVQSAHVRCYRGAMRPLVSTLATAQCTDTEIDAALAAVEQAPMTAAEIVLAVEARHGGRADMRATLAEAGLTTPRGERLGDIADTALTQLETHMANGLDLDRRTISLVRAVLPYVEATMADRLRVLSEGARQYLGFTANGYDADLRAEAESAEVEQAADREEMRRRMAENAH
jgi:hypothetical protein